MPWIQYSLTYGSKILIQFKPLKIALKKVKCIHIFPSFYAKDTQNDFEERMVHFHIRGKKTGIIINNIYVAHFSIDKVSSFLTDTQSMGLTCFDRLALCLKHESHLKTLETHFFKQICQD